MKAPNLNINEDFVRHFTQHVLESEVTSIRPLTGGVLNHLYKIDLNQKSGRVSYVLKIFSPEVLDPNACATRKEIFNLQSLAYKNQGPVPNVFDFWPNFEGHDIIMMEWLNGSRSNHFGQTDLYALGQSIAQFHLSTSDVPAFKKQADDFKSLTQEIKQSIKRMFLDTSVLTEMKYLYTLAGYALSTFTQPPTDSLPQGLVHGDLHPGNVLLERGRFILLDFELCYQGPLIKDLANAVCMFCFDRTGLKPEFSFPMMSALLSGYHSIRPIQKKELKCLPNFLFDRVGLERVANHKLALLGKPPGSVLNHEYESALSNAMDDWFNHSEDLLEFKPHINLNRASSELLYLQNAPTAPNAARSSHDESLRPNPKKEHFGTAPVKLGDLNDKKCALKA